jgi:hypothetical protein
MLVRIKAREVASGTALEKTVFSVEDIRSTVNLILVSCRTSNQYINPLIMALMIPPIIAPFNMLEVDVFVMFK